MALGIDTTSSSGSGDFLPIVKYDARAGRIARVDRKQGVNGWESDVVDITKEFSAVMDLANIEVGWISYDPRPDFKTAPIGVDHGPAPSDKHKQGFQMTVKLGGKCGGDLRQISSTAKSTIGGFNLLHDEYVKGAAANPGMLPVVKLGEVTQVTSGEGAKKSTNYAPTWRIDRWVPRPADLVAPAAKAAAPAAQTAPSTGSTKVGAPAQAAVSSPAGDEDFG